GAGADLVDPPPGEIAGDRRDPVQQPLVEDEVLAERPGSGETVPRDHLAQRRQLVQPAHAAARRAAHSPAVRIAEIIAPGSARSLPAMSKAVPWSGEVRTIGNPSVTLIPSSK